MNVNFVVVFIAAIAPMVLGFIWYGPLFGAKWMKIMGITKKDIEAKKADLPRMYFLMFLSAIVMSYVLARLIVIGGASNAISGAVVGFWTWIGFIATVKLGDVLFNGSPLNLYYIDVTYRLISLVIMGAILGIWR